MIYSFVRHSQSLPPTPIGGLLIGNPEVFDFKEYWIPAQKITGMTNKDFCKSLDGYIINRCSS